MNDRFVVVRHALPTLRSGEDAVLGGNSLLLRLTLEEGRVIRIPIRDVLHEARVVNFVTRVQGRRRRLPRDVTTAVQARLRKKKKRLADDDVEMVGGRTVEERNAEGFEVGRNPKIAPGGSTASRSESIFFLV